MKIEIDQLANIAYAFMVFLIVGELVWHFFVIKPERHPENFQIAKDGGVLETMNKDEDGNISLKLTKKIKVSEDTFIFRFGFDDNKTLGLPIGKHVVFSANIKTKAEPNGELICRKYTPIS